MKNFYASAMIGMFLTSCVATDVVGNWSHVDDHQTRLSFSHPSEWGSWVQDNGRFPPEGRVWYGMSFSSMVAPSTSDSSVFFDFRRYDADTHRYEEVCVSEVDLCDSMKQQDLLEEKEKFESQAVQNIDGVPARIIDSYGPGGAVLMRNAEFYTSTYRVRMHATFDIADFLSARLDNEDQSLSEVFNMLIGKDPYEDSIRRMASLYPAEMKDATAFFNDIDALIVSMRISN